MCCFTCFHVGGASAFISMSSQINLRGQPNSKVWSSMCLRVCQLGRFALRQEQRGGCMGEGQRGDGDADACLPGFYSNINVHQWANSPCVLRETYNPSLSVKYQDQCMWVPAYAKLWILLSFLVHCSSYSHVYICVCIYIYICPWQCKWAAHQTNI